MKVFLAMGWFLLNVQKWIWGTLCQSFPTSQLAVLFFLMMNQKSLSLSGSWKNAVTSIHLSSISIPMHLVSLWLLILECSQGSKVWASKCGTILQFLLQHTVPPPWTWKPLPDWQSAGRKQRTWEMWTVMEIGRKQLLLDSIYGMHEDGTCTHTHSYTESIESRSAQL